MLTSISRSFSLEYFFTNPVEPYLQDSISLWPSLILITPLCSSPPLNERAGVHMLPLLAL